MFSEKAVVVSELSFLRWNVLVLLILLSNLLPLLPLSPDFEWRPGSSCCPDLM